jgi:hypothetical protein
MKDPVALTTAELEAKQKAIQEAVQNRVAESGLDNMNIMPTPDAVEWMETTPQQDYESLGRAMRENSVRDVVGYCNSIMGKVDVLNKRDEPNPMTLHQIEPANPDTLLFENALLARGQSMVIVAPSGIGKSVFTNQAAYCLAGGKPFMGIQPVKPLRVYILQSEDDPGLDVYPMKAGIRRGLTVQGLYTDAEITEIEKSDRVLMQQWTPGDQNGLLKHVHAVIKRFNPDLLIFNPMFAYACCDLEKSAEARPFFRNTLQPLLESYPKETRPGVWFLHHTPRDRSKPVEVNADAREYLYHAHGSTELVNYPRVVLTIAPLKSGDLKSKYFLLMATKHGDRLKWCDEYGEPTLTRIIAHSTPDDARQGLFYWRDPEQYEIKRLTQINAEAKADNGMKKTQQKHRMSMEVVKDWSESITARTMKTEAHSRLKGLLQSNGLPSGNDHINALAVHAIDAGWIKRDPPDRLSKATAYYLPGLMTDDE